MINGAVYEYKGRYSVNKADGGGTFRDERPDQRAEHWRGIPFPGAGPLAAGKVGFLHVAFDQICDIHRIKRTQRA
jgi:hypothetical protein